MGAREQFAELITRPDEAIPLAEAALWIAAESNAETDVEAALEQLALLGEEAGRVIADAPDEAECIARLNHYLFVEAGFEGNRKRYDDPRNSFLDVVLERRTGIPITLSVIYIEVARRIGLSADGIGFPGHFLSKITLESGFVVVDPFFGRTLSLEDCRERLKAVAGPEAQFDPRLLSSTSHRAILQRILGNLKHIYTARRDLESALACSDRILLLAPNEPVELRDRGLLNRELGCFGAALEDLERYVDVAPVDRIEPAIGSIIASLRTQRSRLH